MLKVQQFKHMPATPSFRYQAQADALMRTTQGC